MIESWAESVSKTNVLRGRIGQTERYPLMLTDIMATLPDEKCSLLRILLRNLEEGCLTFLSSTAIPDEFGDDHEARREWRVKMIKLHGDDFERSHRTNKLRANNITGAIYSYVTGVVEILDEFEVEGEQAEMFRGLRRQLPNLETYNGLSIEEKLAVVAKMDEIADLFLQMVAETEQAGS